MGMDLRGLLNSADSEEDDSIVFGGEDEQKRDLYRYDEKRPTEHVIVVNDLDMLRMIEEILEEDDRVEYEYEDEDNERVIRIFVE